MCNKSIQHDTNLEFVEEMNLFLLLLFTKKSVRGFTENTYYSLMSCSVPRAGVKHKTDIDTLPVGYFLLASKIKT